MQLALFGTAGQVILLINDAANLSIIMKTEESSDLPMIICRFLEDFDLHQELMGT